MILENIKSHVKEQSTYGFDAYKEVYCDMIEAGIVDPVKVTRSAAERCFRGVYGADHRSRCG
ncbi:MAG: hypothetical protein ACLTNY_05165 [Blautia massiliensis (ex Durand et al. 2017)]